MINVTKTFLPPLEEYTRYLEMLWDSRWVTNHGPLLKRLEGQLSEYLGCKYIRCVNNGTVALQVAIKALALKDEVITTPFSYVATSSSLAWEGCTPVFADIDSECLTLDPKKIEAMITGKTTGIVATHVYGNPCDVNAIQGIADRNGLKVIYDAAHCFGTRYANQSVMNYGQLSTLSFHATKIFHTIEGGAIVSQDSELDSKVSSLMNFGHDGPDSFRVAGINGKQSEFHAAMGLCLLPRMADFISVRRELSNQYDSLLLGPSSSLVRPRIRENTEYNFAYYPIIFPTESILLRVSEVLKGNGILPRRYFYPSLSTLNYVGKYNVPISDDISSRVLCLPLYFELTPGLVEKISKLVLSAL